MKNFDLNKFKFHEVPFWQFFRMGWDGRALLEESFTGILFWVPMNPLKDWKAKVERDNFLRFNLVK
jgi:hypothetical protein